MKLALFVIGCALITITVLSRVRSARWWIRACDFPRLQVSILLLVVATAFASLSAPLGALDGGFIVALLGCLAYQFSKIVPYTPLAPRQVRDAVSGSSEQSLRLLVSNVLMQNRRDDDFLALVSETDPDLVLALETDAWWDKRLRALDRAYPHAVRHPLENEYGIHLFSKLELIEPAVRFLVEHDIPSIRTDVRLRSGDIVEFNGIHPRPPLPEQDTEPRDAEILIVARHVNTDPKPSIVAGDLNDVAWSHTTQLFQRISGMLDPRRGRGLFSTFHAGYPMFRWPLDHVFHDATFTLVRLQRLRNIGSDHFPVLVELRYDPSALKEHETPTAHHEDLEEAKERIAEGAGVERPA